MTDNEIIKVLERLSAEDPDGFSADVLEMVNRLLDEIKKMKDQIDDLHAYENKIKIAAYKDFADMVRDTFFYDISNSKPKEAKFPCAVMYAIEKEIEKALKEMVGEDE